MKKGNTENKEIRILVISDIHYLEKNADDLEKVFSSFLEALSLFLKDNREWTPDCVALVGDLAQSAKKEEYKGVEQLIGRIKDEIGRELHILPVPGNHDKKVSRDNASLDQERAIQFLKENSKDFEEKEKKESNTNFLKDYFEFYSDFAGSCYQTDKEKGTRWESIPCFQTEPPYDKIQGCFIIERLHLCVMALNTEWAFVRNKDKELTLPLTVGETFVEQMEKEVRLLKSKGYTVITMMHRSPYRLCWKDLWGNLEKRSPVERIIDLSDLIICGHEHNGTEHDPDLLMNATQLFQNGSSFSNQTVDARYPYIASLMRISPDKRLIHQAQFHYNMNETQNVQWQVPADSNIKTFYMDALLSPRIQRKSFSNELYKEITLLRPYSSRQLEQKIRRLFYPNNSPSESFCEIWPLSAQIKQKVIQFAEEYVNSGARAEQFGEVHVIIYSECNCCDCSENGDRSILHQKKEAISLYKEIKALAKDKEISHKLIFNLVFCNILV